MAARPEVYYDVVRRGYSSHGVAIHRAAEKGKSYNP